MAAKPKPTTSAAKAKLKGSGAVAQGRRAKAAAKRAVMVEGNVTAPIATDGDIFQMIINPPPNPASAGARLRERYLIWITELAKELPLFTGDSGDQVKLSSVYTALLTKFSSEIGEFQQAARLRDDKEREQLSALEAMDANPALVLLGGPGSGKTTFLNFIAFCMAGELLGRTDANLKLLRTPIPVDADGEKKPKQQRWSHRALLPVRIVLRDFVADLPKSDVKISADTLWNFLVKQLPHELQGYADELRGELSDQGGLVLLDGLDEVPDALQRRDQVKHAVQQFAARHPRCRFLVTSRTYAYQHQDWKLSDFAETELLPFTRGQIHRFIEVWYAHMVQLGRLTKTDAAGRASLLKRGVERKELRELAERPLLLTLMARLQPQNRGSLPSDREELYSQSVSMLLDEWESLKLRPDPEGKPVPYQESIGEWLNASKHKIRIELDKLAYEAHLNQQELEGTADIPQAAVEKALRAASEGNLDAKLFRLEEYLRDRSGLLNSHGEGLYQFPHRSFQEYMAACHLARFKFPDELSSLAKRDPNRWREVMLLAASRSRAVPASIWDLVEELCSKDEVPAEHMIEPNSEALWGALLAGQVLQETGLIGYDLDLQARHERKRLRVRDWQVRLLTSTVLPGRERALAGDLLAMLGETRSHLLDVDHLRFSFVPQGAFWMGEENSDDAGLHRNTFLDYDYWIAQTLVTVAQFQQFVEAVGRGSANLESLEALENRPVANVSWYDAKAFCEWLTQRWSAGLPPGWRVELPSEAEWEKAARGGEELPIELAVATARDGFELPRLEFQGNPLPYRRYPWSDDFSADMANVSKSVGVATTPGCFSLGRSPYGCEDVAGNVWEWTRSLWGEEFFRPEFRYPYDPHDVKRENSEASSNVHRVVRGGSFDDLHDDARCACRGRPHPGNRFDFIGFRVVLRSPPV